MEKGARSFNLLQYQLISYLHGLSEISSNTFINVLAFSVRFNRNQNRKYSIHCLFTSIITDPKDNSEPTILSPVTRFRHLVQECNQNRPPIPHGEYLSASQQDSQLSETPPVQR